MKLKLKYYLRGLGVGIVVTAVIMCIAASKERKMTDEEIKARAKQLGMIESTVLTESIDEEDNEAQGSPDSGDVAALSKVSAAELDTQAEGSVSDSGTRTENSVSDSETQPENSVSDSETQAENSVSDSGTQPENSISVPDTQVEGNVTEPDTQGSANAAEAASEFPKVIIISSGEGSYTVSKKLAEIGVVESAEDFDTYLCEHGYDKKIRAGTYTIPVGAADEQIAKIVTGTKITE